jgi:translation initiation factor IF-2
LNLKANPDRIARGTIIESHLDKGKGVLASVMVQKGTLKIGDAFVAGIYSGRVRAMYDERGHRVESAGPSVPVQVSGFDGAPQAGDLFAVLEQEAEASAIKKRTTVQANASDYSR